MYDKHRVVAFSFVAITVGAWAYLIGPTVNYLHYYSALDQLGVDVASMSVRSSPSNVTVNIEFLVSNPTPYVGLQLVSLAYQAKLPSGGDFAVIGVGTAGSGPALLQADSSLGLPADFVLTGLGMTQFSQICESSQHSLSWSIEGSIGLGTRNGVLVHQFQIPAATGC